MNDRQAALMSFLTSLLALPLGLLCYLPAGGSVCHTAVSSTVDDFLSVANGDMDNWKQHKDGSKGHALVQLTMIPVDLPALRPAKLFYHKASVDGKELGEDLVVVTEKPGHIVHLEVHSYRNLGIHTSVGFNVTELSKLEPEDLTGGNCTAVYKQISRGAYTGAWYDCENLINGRQAFFTDIYECTSMHIFTSPTASEIYNQFPYVLRRSGERYSMPGITDTFDQICGEKH